MKTDILKGYRYGERRREKREERMLVLK